MNTAGESTELFRKAMIKYKLLIEKYPLEIYEITNIINNSDNFEQAEVQQAFKKLHLILDDVKNYINT